MKKQMSPSKHVLQVRAVYPTTVDLKGSGPAIWARGQGDPYETRQKLPTLLRQGPYKP